MKSQQKITKWNRICNMRSTLLQLQYLYCSISEDIQKQSKNFTNMHKDRLLQIDALSKETKLLSVSNFRTILIVKLESLLTIVSPIDELIWHKLNKFKLCVQYLEEQMSRDVCKLYIGNNLMLNIEKCEAQLTQIEDKIQKYLKDNAATIQEYNRKMEQIFEIEENWKKYLAEMGHQIREIIIPAYPKYLKRKLEQKQIEIEENIKILRDFIKS